MRWRPLSLAALLSVALLLGLLVIWAASHEDPGGVKFGPLVNANSQMPFHAVHVRSEQGGVWLQLLRPSRATGASSKTHVNLLGLSVTSGDALVERTATYVNSIALRIPYWFFVAVAAFVPMLWMRDLRRQRRRLMTGHCPRCGFDMHITPDACPECGLAIFHETAGVEEGAAGFRNFRRAPV